MNYFKLILSAIFTIFFSQNISAQILTSTHDEEDQVKVYNSKIDLLTKVKANIERKYNLDTHEDDDRDDQHQANKPKQKPKSQLQATKSKIKANREKGN